MAGAGVSRLAVRRLGANSAGLATTPDTGHLDFPDERDIVQDKAEIKVSRPVRTPTRTFTLKRTDVHRSVRAEWRLSGVACQIHLNNVSP